VPTLSEQLLSEPRRSALINDLAVLFENHVGSLKGLKGMGMKTGLSMLRAARPNALPEAVTRLLPESLAHLEPEYSAWQKAGAKQGFDAYLLRDQAKLTDRLIGVVDDRVGASQNSTLRTMYPKLRGNIASEVSALAPRLAQILVRHLNAAG